MKTSWITLLLLLTVCSCLPEKINKKDDVAPELAGTYQISTLAINGTTYIPRQGISGQLIVNKDSETQLSLSLSLTENGSVATDDLGEVTIRKASGTQYEMIGANSTRLGTIDGVTFSLNIVNSGGSLNISAKK